MNKRQAVQLRRKGHATPSNISGEPVPTVVRSLRRVALTACAALLLASCGTGEQVAQETIGLDLTHSDDTLSITLVPKTVTDEWFAASYEIRNDSDRSVWVVSQDHPHVVANLADGSHVLALAFVTAPEQAGTYMPAAHAVTELPPGQSMDSTVSMPRPFVIEPGVERGKQSVVDMDSVRLCVAHIDQDIVPEGLPKSGLLPGDVLAVPDAVGLELQRISCSTPVSLS